VPTLVLARYVEALRAAANTTKRAEDRGKYTSLLADAAVLLAQSVQAVPSAKLAEAVQHHERLRGQLWLEDAIQSEPARIWKEALQAINGHAI
jgi:hypothetical protein